MCVLIDFFNIQILHWTINHLKIFHFFYFYLFNFVYRWTNKPILRLTNPVYKKHPGIFLKLYFQTSGVFLSGENCLPGINILFLQSLPGGKVPFRRFRLHQ